MGFYLIFSDHLERHKTFTIILKLNLNWIFSLNSTDIAFINKKEPAFKKFIKSKKMRCKIIDVKHKLSKHENNLIKNIYFKNLNNQQNLSFVLKICSKLGIKKYYF